MRRPLIIYDFATAPFWIVRAKETCLYASIVEESRTQNGRLFKNILNRDFVFQIFFPVNRRQCCGSGMFIHPRSSIPDPGLTRSRIPNPESGSASKKLSIFNLKTDTKFSSLILDLDFFPDPGPGVKKAPDPGSGSATLKGDVCFACSLL